jgi:RNA-splicing ligase RtcB
MARHSKAKRNALKNRQIISHNVASLMGKFDTMSHRGYVCQNLAKPKEHVTTWQERQRIRQAHAR